MCVFAPKAEPFSMRESTHSKAFHIFPQRRTFDRQRHVSGFFGIESNLIIFISQRMAYNNVTLSGRVVWVHQANLPPRRNSLCLAISFTFCPWIQFSWARILRTYFFFLRIHVVFDSGLDFVNKKMQSVHSKYGKGSAGTWRPKLQPRQKLDTAMAIMVIFNEAVTIFPPKSLIVKLFARMICISISKKFFTAPLSAHFFPHSGIFLAFGDSLPSSLLRYFIQSVFNGVRSMIGWHLSYEYVSA